MAPNVFLCDGAKMPARWQGEIDQPAQRLNHSGLDPEVNLQIENLSHVLLGSIDGRAADLVKIASYAYSADQSVSRGGEADVYGRKWHRQMRLAIPVSDPRFWQRRSTSTALQADSGLRFRRRLGVPLHESQGSKQSQLLLGLPENEICTAIPIASFSFRGAPTVLSAAVEAIESGRRPLLVSHRTSPVPPTPVAISSCKSSDSAIQIGACLRSAPGFIAVEAKPVNGRSARDRSCSQAWPARAPTTWASGMSCSRITAW